MGPRLETATALLRRVPTVYVGPAAERSLQGESGVLLGAHRPDWVDVLEFDPRGGLPLRRLVELRFATHARDAVGLSLSSRELRRSGARLLSELVPGDVVITESGARVHTGSRWVQAKLVGGGRGSRAPRRRTRRVT